MTGINEDISTVTSDVLGSRHRLRGQHRKLNKMVHDNGMDRTRYCYHRTLDSINWLLFTGLLFLMFWFRLFFFIVETSMFFVPFLDSFIGIMLEMVAPFRDLYPWNLTIFTDVYVVLWLRQWSIDAWGIRVNPLWPCLVIGIQMRSTFGTKMALVSTIHQHDKEREEPLLGFGFGAYICLVNFEFILALNKLQCFFLTSTIFKLGCELLQQCLFRIHRCHLFSYR